MYAVVLDLDMIPAHVHHLIGRLFISCCLLLYYHLVILLLIASSA